MRRTRCAGPALLLIFCIVASYLLRPAHYHDRAWQRERDLACGEHGVNFTIALFTDLHFGETEAGDARSKAIMEGILGLETGIDLVVFGGDQVSGWSVWEALHEKHAEALSVVAGHGIPFATIFGNHDDQPWDHLNCLYQWAPVLLAAACLALASTLYWPGYRRWACSAGLTVAAMAWICWEVYPSTQARESLLHHEKTRHDALSRTQQGDYFLPVTCQQERFLLFFLDSGGGRIPEGLTSGQSDWVAKVSRRHASAPSVLFAHIPPREFGRTSSLFRCWGTQEEPTSAAGIETMASSLFHAGVKAVFVGHDHGNSWCCVPKRAELVQQPALCYGRHTGQGGYGDLERGARLIRLSFTGGVASVDTWLRLEGGHKVEEGVLATFIIQHPQPVIRHRVTDASMAE